MNDRMTAGDWLFCFFSTFCLIIIAVILNHHMTKAERLENELARLKTECITKGYAEYAFNNKGEVVFKIKESKK